MRTCTAPTKTKAINTGPTYPNRLLVSPGYHSTAKSLNNSNLGYLRFGQGLGTTPGDHLRSGKLHVKVPCPNSTLKTLLRQTQRPSRASDRILHSCKSYPSRPTTGRAQPGRAITKMPLRNPMRRLTSTRTTRCLVNSALPWLSSLNPVWPVVGEVMAIPGLPQDGLSTVRTRVHRQARIQLSRSSKWYYARPPYKQGSAQSAPATKSWEDMRFPT